jgi:hypothetical protein
MDRLCTQDAVDSSDSGSNELGSLVPVTAVQHPSTCLDQDRLATIKPMSPEAPQLLERYVVRDRHALVPTSHIEDGSRAIASVRRTER